MKLFIFLALNFSYSVAYDQINESIKALSSNDLNGVEIAIFKVVTKEMVPPDGQPLKKLLIKKSLTEKEMKALLKKASKRSSYAENQALLSHWNVVIEFERNDKRIEISTITGNISVIENEVSSYGHISDKFGHYLYRFLNSTDLLKYIDVEHLEGLTR